MKSFKLLLGFEICLLLLTQQAKAATASLTVDDVMDFSPAVLTINAGDTVVFENTDTHPHSIIADPALAQNPANISLPPGATPFHSEELTTGQTYSFTLTTPGTYKYVCGRHEKMGMKGQIVVLPKADDVSSSKVDSPALELYNYDCRVTLFHKGAAQDSKKFQFQQKPDADDYLAVAIADHTFWIQSTTASQTEHGLVFGIDKNGLPNKWMHASSLAYVPVPYLHQYFSISEEDFFSADCKRTTKR